MGKKILIDVSARGKAGGKARAAKMTPDERSAAARKAVTVRWDRVRAAKRKPRSRRKVAA